MIDRMTLVGLLKNSAVELRFMRRNKKPGFGPYRRMLATNSPLLVRSVPGRLILDWKPPTGHLDYIPSAENLVIAFDLFWHEYRAIPLETCEIQTRKNPQTGLQELSIWPPIVSKNKEGELEKLTESERLDLFWKWFRNLESAPPHWKLLFMNT